MARPSNTERRRGAVALSEFVSRVIDPVTARRGFATADLLSAWPSIAGPLYADCTAPEKIMWPRQSENAERAAGVLVIRVDGPRAIFVQHELGQIVERVNAFLGYGAIAQARIVQGRVRAEERPRSEPKGLTKDDEKRLSGTLADLPEDGLRAALDRLGRAVLAERKRSP